MKFKKDFGSDTYILIYGNNGCDIPYKRIRDISRVIGGYYHQSAPEFWMWKMFQFGYAYGKRSERARRKLHER
jgi:hypothetical protein